MHIYIHVYIYIYIYVTYEGVGQHFFDPRPIPSDPISPGSGEHINYTHPPLSDSRAGGWGRKG